MNPGTHRREFIKRACLGAASLAVSGYPKAGGSQKMPNILFLFTDDQRFDTIRALGNDHIRTPTMDSLVRRGTTFTNAYIMGGQSAAVCMPSRAMLMTGRHLFNVVDNGRVIPEDHALMPEVFRAAGYRTFGTGKYHNGPRAFARSFTDGGRIFFGGMSDHYKVPVMDFDPTGKYPTDKRYSVDGTHSSELFSDAAIGFLESIRGDDTPFFMYVSYTAPHDPREMPKEYLDMYDPDSLPIPENFLAEHPFDNGELKVRDEKLAPWPRTHAEIRKHLAAYYAMITHVDAQIGRVLKALEDAGHLDDTIIAFAGDNGLAVGQHGLLGKQNLYEHSIHVPLIFCGPGVPEGERRDAFCYLFDIFPTLCGLTGLPIPDSADGVSLVPVIQGGSDGARAAMFFAYKNYQRAVRTDRYKLILYNVDGKKKTQLFDLQNDPRETKNLADDPENGYIVRRLTWIMKDWFKKTGDGIDLSSDDWSVPIIPAWGTK